MGVKKRGPQSWEIVWELGRDPETGERRQVAERFHGTKNAALERYVERQRDLNDGIGGRTPHLTVAQLGQDWLAQKRLEGRRPETLRGYAHMIRDYIDPQLGPIEVASLTALDVQRAIRVWATRPRRDRRTHAETISPRRVQYAHRTLSTMLKQAVRWQLVSRNVAMQVQGPTVPRNEAAWWTTTQAAQFLTVAQGHSYGIVYALALLTGMRRGELLGARWQDLDAEARTITIRQTQDSRHPRTFGTPKSQAGRRTIQLDDQTMDLLRAHQTAQKRQRLIAGEAYQDWGLICCTGIGTPINPSNINRAMARLITQAGLPFIPFHDLRHTHGAMLREQGVDWRVMADRLGHAQVSFTIQVYSHASVGAQATAAAAISKALLGGSSGDKDSSRG